MKKKWKKNLVKKIIWQTIKLLPTSVRGQLIRWQFKIDPPTGDYNKIIYKIADTRDELEQAFKLVQKTYLEMNLTLDNENLMRLSKFNALPTTLVFVAIYDGKVIATISQILDAGLGLPIEKFSDISKFRSSGKRLCEISGLAIESSWRSRSTGVYFPLSSFAIMYAKEFIGIDKFFIVTRAHVRYFYQSLYGFKGVDSNIKKYGLVNDTLAYSQYLNSSDLLTFLKDKFSGAKDKDNLYLICKDFPQNFPWKNQCVIKPLKYNLCSKFFFKPHDLEYFFKENADQFSQMDEMDLRVLKTAYHTDEYKEIISDKKFTYKEFRGFQRFDVYLKCKYKILNQEYNAVILDLSSKGFAVLFETTELIPDTFEGCITLNDNQSIRVCGSPCWSNGSRVGFLITSVDYSKWGEMIEYCHKHISHQEIEEDSIAA